MYRLFFIIIIFFVLPLLLYGGENKDFSKLFSRSETNTRLSQIKSALKSFKDLTDIIHSKSNLKKDYNVSVIYEKKIPEEAEITVKFTGSNFRKTGNLDWDIQHIGFYNWTKYVEGYIDFLELENTKLKLQLSIIKEETQERIKYLQQEVDTRRINLMEKYIDDKKWVD